MKKELFYVVGLVVLVLAFIVDKQILPVIQSLRGPFLTSIMLVATSSVVVIFGIILIGIYYFYEKKKKIGGLVILTPGFVYLISLILKFIFRRARPDISLVSSLGYSFPSAHAAVVFSILPLIENKFVRNVWLVFALIISFSRLYLGVHYLSDVIFGALFGLFIGEVIKRWV